MTDLSAADVAPAPLGAPTVVVDGLHVKYRVFASGKATTGKMGERIPRTRGMREVHALKGLSFVVRQGESIGIIGHNGSGKSTLLRTIAGLQPATEGAVYASAQPALLGVNAALLNNLSGDKNVRLGALALGFTPAEIDERADEIIDFAGLEEFRDLPMRTYSSGMQARLRFSIAIAKSQQILMIDEALAVGDKRFRKRSEQRIRDMRDEAGTVFLVSHSISSIMDTCTRVLWIDHGELRLDGDPQTVCDAYLDSTL
ncbi:ABC transporter ATP-binding protein [Galbitalea sp. SE-J8]|uniref:ABC transporter ATP-binding protein n=1 Tax=Galbitalea sp. SE-J8 TaxID=3054952 RepID=UPI00259C90DD|nr:ABC transporter ATP-binding protein [Galbitalea sp. SE-J8]MDM4762727.1 ABC transporter ATP-binding protein [Galbitalea sp. SE-J8]